MNTYLSWSLFVLSIASLFMGLVIFIDSGSGDDEIMISFFFFFVFVVFTFILWKNNFYKRNALRPEWVEKKIAEDGAELTDKEKKEIKPMQRVFKINPKTLKLIWKVSILLAISFVSLALAVEVDMIPMYSVNFAFFIGFAFGPICISFPIWLFTGRKSFWKNFYKTSLYFWALYLFVIFMKMIF